MLQSIWKMIKKNGLKSRLARTMVLLAAASAALCIIFLSFFMVHMRKNYLSLQKEQNFRYLQQIENEGDEIFNQAQMAVLQLTTSSDIMAATVRTRYDESTVDSAVVALANTADNFTGVKLLVLYLKNSDYVISSRRERDCLEDSGYREMIQAYNDGTINTYEMTGTDKVCTFFEYNGEYYLARKFPVHNENYLAILFYRISIKNLTSNIGGNSNIFIIDSTGQTVAGEKLAAEFSEAQLEEAALNTGSWAAFGGARSLICISSDINGWNYYYVMEMNAGKAFRQFVMPMMFPLLLLIVGVLALALCGEFFVFYKPLHILMENAEQLRALENAGDLSREAGEDEKGRKKVDEFEYLGSLLEDSHARQVSLTDMLKQIDEDVLNRFFRSLIDGVQISEEKALEVLGVTNDQFHIDDIYAICKVGYQEPENRPGAADRKQRIQESIRDLVFHFARENSASWYIPEREQGVYEIVLAFSGKETLVSARKKVLTLLPLIEKLGRQEGIIMMLGIGDCYHSVLDIGFSAREAEKNYHMLSEKTKIEERPLSDEKPAAGDDRGKQNIQQEGQNDVVKFRQVTDYMENGDYRNARILFRRMVKQQITEETDADRKLHRCVKLLNQMVNVIAAKTTSDIKNMDADFFGITDPKISDEDLLDAVMQSYDSMIELYQKRLKRENNKYIAAARKIIEEQYGDSSLSLSSIADAIGVSPTYLSKLFKSGMNQNFSTYVNHFRIEKSKQLLLETDWQIKKIAEECGYNSVQNYIRVFRKEVGIAPGEYRAQ